MKIKHKKILLTTLGAMVVGASITTLAIACSSKPTPPSSDPQQPPTQNQPNNPTQPSQPSQPDNPGTGGSGGSGGSGESGSSQPTTPVKESDFKTRIANLTENEVSLQRFSAFPSAKENTFANEVSLESIELGLPADLQNAVEYRPIIKIETQGADGLNNSAQTGIIKILFEFKLKSNPQITQEKEITFSGFRRQQEGLTHDGFILFSWYNTFRYKGDPLVYSKWTQEQKFNEDNPKYIDALQNRLHQGRPWYEVRTSLTNNTTKISEFNQKASQVGIDTYENAAYKGYTLPKYSEDGQFLGLSIPETDTPKVLGWVDALGRNENQITGLMRTLPNEDYKRFALQTQSITFYNDDPEKPNETNSSKSTSGTTWILDFKKTDDPQTNYPTKWYFGTNLHVADAFNTATKRISLEYLKGENARVRTTYRPVGLNNENWESQGFGDDNNKSTINSLFKVVYRATDYLNTTPSQFLEPSQKEKFKDYEEYLDFAIIEMDLSSHPNGAEIAKKITNNYANKTNDHIKIKSESYLKNYDKIDYQIARAKDDPIKETDYLYAVGYPRSDEDYKIDQTIDAKEFENLKLTKSLWINSNIDYYDKLGKSETGSSTYTDEQLDRGNYLSYALGHRSFIYKPGIVDNFIAAVKIGQDFHTSSDNKKYINSGLSYMPRHYQPFGGASGSSVRTKNNELLAAYYATYSNTGTGLAAALRSEGYDYHGLYGEYNLPQYDLIYGGGKDQKNSYRQELLKLYGSDNSFKTNLFPNGFADENIPDEYKFKDILNKKSSD